MVSAWCSILHSSVYVCMCVHVCVCERERESERESDTPGFITMTHKNEAAGLD